MLRNSEIEMMMLKKEKGESVIPKGAYCSSVNKLCPYWDSDGEKPYQYNGFCWFLGKGDWTLNGEKKWTNSKTGEVQTGDEMGMPTSLLWDDCKECGINDDFGD